MKQTMHPGAHLGALCQTITDGNFRSARPDGGLDPNGQSHRSHSPHANNGFFNNR